MRLWTFPVVLLVCQCIFNTNSEKSDSKIRSNDGLVESSTNVTTSTDTEHKNRLAVIILFSYELINPLTEFNFRRLNYLHCALTNLYFNIGQTNPLDVYLFTNSSTNSILPTSLTRSFPQLIVRQISDEDWRNNDIPSTDQWKFYSKYGEDYHLQGRWRMEYVPKFVRNMGYKYWLQMDDDTFIVESYPYNIVEQFQRENKVLGVRRRYFHEEKQYVQGLAELTSFWMTVYPFQPIGPLLSRFNSTTTPPSTPSFTSETYDRDHYYQGCFMVWSVDLWFSVPVQDFVRTVIRTQSDITMRWAEQGVQNMIRLLFVPDVQLHRFEEVQVIHGKPMVGQLPQLGCPHTAAAMGDLTGHNNPLISPTSVTILVYHSGNALLELMPFRWDCLEFFTDDELGEHFNCAVDPLPSLYLYIRLWCAAVHGQPSDDCVKITYANARSLWSAQFTVPPVLAANWRDEYTSRHAQIMTSRTVASKRVLVLYPVRNVGVADHLVGIATVFVIGLLTGRAFQIAHRPDETDMFHLVFDSPIDWFREDVDEAWLREPLELPDCFTNSVINYNESVLRSGEYFALNTVARGKMTLHDLVVSDNLDELISVEGGSTLTSFITLNQGLLLKFLQYNEWYRQQFVDMQLTGWNVFGSVVNYLFQPKDSVFEQLRAEREAMTSNDPSVLRIAIQIRLGDAVFRRGNDRNQGTSTLDGEFENNADFVISAVDFKRFFSCAEQIESFALRPGGGRYSKVVWFLVTDSILLRQSAKDLYGDKIVTSLKTPRHSGWSTNESDEDRLDNFKFTVGEWWLFGEADYFVITKHSGFGRTAAMRSMKEGRIYTVTSDDMVCDAQSFSSLAVLQDDWSGI